MFNIRKNEGAVLDPAVIFKEDGAMLRASVVHHVPGRMRLRSPALKGDVFAIADLRSGFGEIAGITAVTAIEGRRCQTTPGAAAERGSDAVAIFAIPKARERSIGMSIGLRC